MKRLRITNYFSRSIDENRRSWNLDLSGNRSASLSIVILVQVNVTFCRSNESTFISLFCLQFWIYWLCKLTSRFVSAKRLFHLKGEFKDILHIKELARERNQDNRAWWITAPRQKRLFHAPKDAGPLFPFFPLSLSFGTVSILILIANPHKPHIDIEIFFSGRALCVICTLHFYHFFYVFDFRFILHFVDLDVFFSPTRISRFIWT